MISIIHTKSHNGLTFATSIIENIVKCFFVIKHCYTHCIMTILSTYIQKSMSFHVATRSLKTPLSLFTCFI